MVINDDCNNPCEGYVWPKKESGKLNLNEKPCEPIFNSPGPIYLLPSTIGCEKTDVRFKRAPCISIKGRIEEKIINDSPGPKYFKEEEKPKPYPPYKPTKRKKEEVLPPLLPVEKKSGAGFYGKNPVYGPGPSFSILGKLNDHPPPESPGPAAYDLPPTIGCYKPVNMYSSPCYSIRGKLKDRDRSEGPGPGSYALPKPEVRGPASGTLGSRPETTVEESDTPGPNRYCPERVRNFPEPPHWSFGIKWCEKVQNGVKDTKQREILDACERISNI